MKGDSHRGHPHEFGAIGLRDGRYHQTCVPRAIGALLIEPQCSRWETVPSTGTLETVVTYWKPESASGRQGETSETPGLSPSEPRWTPDSCIGSKKWCCCIKDNLSVQQYGQAHSQSSERGRKIPGRKGSTIARAALGQIQAPMQPMSRRR